MTFNFLECFDENIDNLDITKNYIYVLKLIDERYYVGRTSNILRRIEEHFTIGGSIYTKKYKPIKVIEVQEELTTDDERIKTIEIMEKYGWEKVRGACWCSLEIKKPDFEKNQKSKPKKIIKLISHENDVNIKYLYCIKNKNIIEISDIINMSAGAIAYRLEKLNIIIRKQLARGYINYIESDTYIKDIEIRNNEREKKKKKCDCNIDYNFDINENNGGDKRTDLKNIKNLIREKIIKKNQHVLRCILGNAEG
jgi:predicted GIY-YIG superfamily endonuclease